MKKTQSGFEIKDNYLKLEKIGKKVASGISSSQQSRWVICKAVFHFHALGDLNAADTAIAWKQSDLGDFFQLTISMGRSTGDSWNIKLYTCAGGKMVHDRRMEKSSKVFER